MTLRPALRFAFAAACLTLTGVAVAQTSTQNQPPTQTPTLTPNQIPTAPQSTAPALPDAPSATVHEQPPAVPTGPTVLLDTTMGRMTCQLFQEEAPTTVANFIGLATGVKPWTDPATQKRVVGKPFYDGTQFHRVIPGFMIQGGDPLANGTGDAGFYIPDEISPSLRFDVPGRLAMANSGPNTNSSQFFVTLQPNAQLNGSYTIFGQCDPASVAVATSIAGVQRDLSDKPFTAVVLTKVTVVAAGQAIPPAPATPAPVAPPH